MAVSEEGTLHLTQIDMQVGQCADFASEKDKHEHFWHTDYVQSMQSKAAWHACTVSAIPNCLFSLFFDELF